MATNLYEYYASQGKTLPSLTERQSIAQQAGISGYAGTADQNTQLLAHLQKTAPATPVPSSTATNLEDLARTGKITTTPPAAPAFDLSKELADFTAPKKPTEQDILADPAVQQQQNTLNEITKQLNLYTIQTERLKDTALDSGYTTGFGSAAAARTAKDRAYDAMVLAANADAIRGNLSLAETRAERALQIKYDTATERIRQIRGDIIKNYDTFTAGEKKLALARLEELDSKDAFVANERENAKEVNKIMLTAAQNGADTATLNRIRSASSFNDAITIAGSALQDPKAKYQLEAARLDNILKREQIATAQKQRSLLGQPTNEQQKAQIEALKEALSSVPVMQDKITLVDALKTHPGMSSRVGTSVYSRGTPSTLGKIAAFFVGAGGTQTSAAADNLSGAGQEFAGSIHKLTGGLTLDNLIAAKERGATFGALSEGELKILADSATALTDWEIKDKNAKGTGYWDIDEVSFKNELDTIKMLTRRALEKSQTTIFTPEEQAVLDTIQALDTTSPANYY
jgi:hypothetical protein